MASAKIELAVQQLITALEAARDRSIDPLGVAVVQDHGEVRTYPAIVIEIGSEAADDHDSLGHWSFEAEMVVHCVATDHTYEGLGTTARNLAHDVMREIRKMHGIIYQGVAARFKMVTYHMRPNDSGIQGQPKCASVAQIRYQLLYQENN